MKRILIALALALGGAGVWAGPAAAAGANTVELTVDGMVCAFCAQGIEKSLRENSATQDVFISLEHHLVAVALKGKQSIPDAELKRVLTEAGYTVRKLEHSRQPLSKIKAIIESKAGES